jgi:hypothetical protein
MDREKIHMIRRAIHITRKTNRATTDMDCAMIHMDRVPDPKGKFLVTFASGLEALRAGSASLC